MPLYEYRCEACGQTFSLLRRFSEREKAAACPHLRLNGDSSGLLNLLRRREREQLDSIPGGRMLQQESIPLSVLRRAGSGIRRAVD
ncbi:MAG: hypothetical protein KatS3mg115_0274 [Candidatus Poribacteria bacterium]|nr:MAG: hypothetical protein KatS3mg115_0274 [Candidatus Poribacteria bacterium]